MLVYCPAETAASKAKSGKQQPQAPKDAKRGAKGASPGPPADKKTERGGAGKKDKASPERAPATPAAAGKADAAQVDEKSKKHALGRVNDGPVAFAQGSLLFAFTAHVLYCTVYIVHEQCGYLLNSRSIIVFSTGVLTRLTQHSSRYTDIDH